MWKLKHSSHTAAGGNAGLNQPDYIEAPVDRRSNRIAKGDVTRHSSSNAKLLQNSVRRHSELRILERN